MGLYKLRAPQDSASREVSRDPASRDIDRMRAQGYDGAANMVRIHRGVQAIISYREMGACRGGETKQPGGHTKLHK